MGDPLPSFGEASIQTKQNKNWASNDSHLIFNDILYLFKKKPSFLFTFKFPSVLEFWRSIGLKEDQLICNEFSEESGKWKKNVFLFGAFEFAISMLVNIGKSHITQKKALLSTVWRKFWNLKNFCCERLQRSFSKSSAFLVHFY